MRHTITSRLEPRGKISKRAVALQERFDELGAKIREVRAEREAAEARAIELAEKLTRAYESAELEVVDGEPKPTGAQIRKLEGELAKAREHAEGPWPERTAAIERAQDRIRSEHEALIREHRDELIDELVPLTIEANDRAREALEQLREALTTRAQHGRELETLLNLTEGPGHGHYADKAGDLLGRELRDVDLEPPIPNLLKAAA